MSFLSIIGKGLQAMLDEALTPESFKNGQKFEDYVIENIFDEENYVLVEKTHDYKSNSKQYVESSLKPDFKFRDKISKKEFYVEAKFRSKANQGKVQWCNEKQLFRYKQYNKEKPVFLILGMGDDSENPEKLFLIPMSEIAYTGLFPSFLEKYKIKTNKSISSRNLWDR